MTLVIVYNFQIHRFTEEDALNLSGYFLVLIFFEMTIYIYILNKQIKHISLSGVSNIFLVWDVFSLDLFRRFLFVV